MNITQRLQQLEVKMGERRAWLSSFKLEDGSTFTTELDPMTYLLQYGSKTERGRITGYEPPPGAHDPITGAVYAEIRRLVFNELLAHPVEARDIRDFE